MRNFGYAWKWLWHSHIITILNKYIKLDKTPNVPSCLTQACFACHHPFWEWRPESMKRSFGFIFCSQPLSVQSPVWIVPVMKRAEQPSHFSLAFIFKSGKRRGEKKIQIFIDGVIFERVCIYILIFFLMHNSLFKDIVYLARS